jgi:hypothetical protein
MEKKVSTPGRRGTAGARQEAGGGAAGGGAAAADRTGAGRQDRNSD